MQGQLCISRHVYAALIRMVFIRSWDSSYPRVWDRWEANGRTWLIQDLPPADDDKAVDLLVEHLLPDETLCVLSNVCDDPQSIQSFRDIWKAYVGQRMNLACYTEVEGQKTLVALNACYVACRGEDDEQEYEGESCKNVIAVLKYYKTRCDSFDLLGVDQALNALGLVVMRQYRGLKLGERLLAAREPLCRSLGIKGSETIFTGPASQKLAARCGFKSVLEISMRELAAIGLKYPQDDRVIKVMIKEYK